MLICAGKAQAQTGFYAKLWQTENGLPNNIVQAITQTLDGYLWIGTREGLCRFDGEKFKMIHLAPESMEPSINSLLAANDGSLWIGTAGKGVFRLNGEGVQHFAAPERGAIFTVFYICESANGSVWFDTDSGILQWSNGTLKWRQDLASGENAVPTKNWKTQMWSNKNPICSDDKGGVWVLNGNLIRADLATPTNYFATPDQLPYSGRTMYFDSEGAFWIGTDSSADNIVIRVKAGVITKYPRQKGPAGFPQMIFRDRAGVLWVGSYEGLSQLINGKFVPFDNLDNTSSSASYKIHAMFQDREQNLWVGSDGGLTRLTPKRFTTFTKQDGLASDMALAVCPSRDGSVWISSWGSGLSHYVDGKIEILNTSNGLPSNFVMGLTETRDGSLWTGVDYNGPLLRIKDGEVHVHKRSGSHGTPALYQDKAGVLWIGNRGGLQTWNGVKFEHFSANDGLSDNSIDAICGGDKGIVWIGTDGGLTRWQNEKFENLAESNPRLHVNILSLYHDDTSGALWIGTRGRGLLRFRDGQVQEFDQKRGLFSDSIYAILEDNHSNLWLNSSRGVFRVNKQQIEAVAAGKEASVISINYGRSDGILASGQYNDATQPAACKDTQGRLWFRTTQGVTMIDPDTVTSNEHPPPVVIQEIVANNIMVVARNFGADVLKPIVIPPGNGSLEIHYAALSYLAPEKNLYRYKLEDVDSDWVNAGNQRVVKYNNLRPGRYQFDVSACNNDGVWNKAGQSVELILEPHFWQTWWFYSLLGLAATGFVAGTARYITRRRMQRKLNQMEQQRAIEQERSRIARDVHDELGAKLTSISFQGSIAKLSLNDPAEIERQIEQMSASAREAVSSLHSIVWAVDPLNDSLEGLVGLISHQVGELFSNSMIRFKIVVPENIPLLHLSANVRHNLFLAVMEAANNSAKHARAAQVLIHIIMRPDELEVLISDDGSGFEMDPASGSGKDKANLSGHGLGNMRKRLEAIGGHFNISSDAKQGTTIHFVVPLEVVKGG